MIDLRLLQLLTFLKCIQFLHWQHCTDEELCESAFWHTLQENFVPGVGPGFCSMPAHINNVRTRPADMAWPLVKNFDCQNFSAEGGFWISLVRSGVFSLWEKGGRL